MRTEYWLWGLLAAPAALILHQFLTDAISYGQTIHRTGQLSAGLLITALAATPLRRHSGTRAVGRLLVLHRRPIGVASFAYAGLHAGVYLEHKWGADLILREGLEPALGTGWLALLVLLILALTSNGLSVRALGGGWKRLHRLVYAGAALTFTHWILATFNPFWAFACLALILPLETTRLTARS
jgi:sulfoxide reductase heme-binding subunit YedZ